MDDKKKIEKTFSVSKQDLELLEKVKHSKLKEKEYNKNYYEQNKTKILDKLGEVVKCPLCSSDCTKVYLSKYQLTKLCKKRAMKNNENDN